MKRTLTLLTALLLASLPICVCAYDFEVDGIYYNITTAGEEVEVTCLSLDTTRVDTISSSHYQVYLTISSDYSGSVHIPSTVTYNSEKYAVTSIGSYAFYYCTGLTSIDIPSSVTSIGIHAFYVCI